LEVSPFVGVVDVVKIVMPNVPDMGAVADVRAVANAAAAFADPSVDPAAASVKSPAPAVKPTAAPRSIPAAGDNGILDPASTGARSIPSTCNNRIAGAASAAARPIPSATDNGILDPATSGARTAPSTCDTRIP